MLESGLQVDYLQREKQSFKIKERLGINNEQHTLGSHVAKGSRQRFIEVTKDLLK